MDKQFDKLTYIILRGGLSKKNQIPSDPVRQSVTQMKTPPPKKGFPG